MSKRLDDYVAGVLGGLWEGAGDVTRGVIHDVGNAGQDILMAHATVRPSAGRPGTMVIERYDMERDHHPSALEADPAPPLTQPAIDMPGIDIDVGR